MDGLRLRRGTGKTAEASSSSASRGDTGGGGGTGGGGEVLSCGGLPAQAEVLNMLPALDVAKYLMVDRENRTAVEELRPRLLDRRGWQPSWSWRKAHAVEAALFRDAPQRGESGSTWTPGPNDGSEGNLMERQGEDEEWLWIRGGTDWQAFQGGVRTVSEEGIRPKWVTFQVRVSTPALSGANLALSCRERGWALHRPTLLFSYRGDDSSRQRCFMLETCSVDGHFKGHRCPVEEVTADSVFKIAIRLDWSKGLLRMFVNGQQAFAEPVSFETDQAIRLAAVYNWRSDAVTAFSELMFGELCPYAIAGLPEESQASRWPCRCRAASRGRAPGARALVAGLVGLGAVALGVLVQQLLLSS